MMDLNIKVNNKKFKYFTESAKESFTQEAQTIIKDFSDRCYDEAKSKKSRFRKSKVEVLPSHVGKAANFSEYNYKSSKRIDTVITICNFLSALFIGIASTPDCCFISKGFDIVTGAILALISVFLLFLKLFRY